MTAKQTTATFSARVSKLTNSTYVVVGEYVNNKTKIAIKHTKCNQTYLVKPKGFLDGNRCPHCRNKLRGAKPKSQQQFESEVMEKTAGEYTVIGQYSGVLNKVEIRHNTCGNSWGVTPNKFLSVGIRCPTCARLSSAQSQMYSTKEFTQKVEERFPNEYTIMSEYVGSQKKVLVKHLPCGHEWWIKASHLLSQNMCPYCKSSKGEALTRQCLTTLGLHFIEQKTFPNLLYKKRLSYDFYIPSKNTLIEYQGKQHYEPIDFFGGTERFLAQQNKNNIKRRYAEEHGLHLLEIPYSINTFDSILAYLEKNIK